MTLADIPLLPMCEIGDALSANTHSRRMAGLLVSLCPKIGGLSAFDYRCFSPEFGIAAADTENQFVIGGLLERNLLPAKKVKSLAEMSLGYKWQTYKDTDDPVIESNMLTALGNPVIGDLAGALFEQGLPKSNPMRRTFRNALLGNPLVHGIGDFPEPAKGDDYRYFLRNCALFGNLENPRVLSALTAAISDAGDGARRGLGAAIKMRLIARGDIDEGLALALADLTDAETSAEGEDRRELVKNPAHQKLVMEGKSGGCAVFPATNRWVVSPAADPEQIERAYQASSSDLDREMSLLLAAQCPASIYLKFEPGDTLLGNEDFLRLSPWSRNYVGAFKTEQFWGAFRRRLLDVETISKGRLRLLTIPSLPFDAISPTQLLDVFYNKADYTVALIVGAIRSARFADALGPIKADIDSSLPRLFSCHTSGRQLEKIAGLHPELTAFAACHPNGIDVPIHAIPASQQRLVATVRASLPAPVAMCGDAGSVGGEIVL